MTDGSLSSPSSMSISSTFAVAPVVPILATIALAGVAVAVYNKASSTCVVLNGPPNPSFLFGCYRQLNEAEDSGIIYEDWANKYGPAYVVPGGLGSSSIVLCDPKAVAHFYSKQTFGYVQSKIARVFIENLFGRGLLWAEGDSHRRQRKALSPAFSNAAIRKLTSVFYDSAYKLKGIWDNILEANSGEAVIDVQNWMNHVSLDSIGIAGFGYNFHALDNQGSEVVKVFDAFGSEDTSTLSRIVFFLGPVLPILQSLPTEQNQMIAEQKRMMHRIADELLEKSRNANEGEVVQEDKSIMGLLLKAEATSSSLSMTQEEILAQNVLLLAGYETTSISLTWALIELSRNPEEQQRLRDELSQSAAEDSTSDQVSASLPYLDAVVHEVLRLHPAIADITRLASEDDVIPFSRPIKLASGSVVNSLVVPKGTSVTISMWYMNRAEVFWGSDAGLFRPRRWLEENGCKGAQEISGYRHILTFADGPRTCLGRSFALAEFKAVLSVLVRNYTFELPDGPDTRIVKHPSILPRPKLEGVKGPKMYLRVKSVL